MEVDPAAVRAEAKLWSDLSEQDMLPIQQNIGRLHLNISAFFIGNLTEAINWQAYETFLYHVWSRVRGARIEFELIATALRGIADAYEETDNISDAQLKELYTVSAEDEKDADQPN